jgi:glycosyltransferase involved in cell wall biosynthesis
MLPITKIMRASIILCTRNRSDSIGETLQALSQLEPSGAEILVVDSSEGLEMEKTEGFSRQYGAKYILELRRGLNIARNTGLANASGDIVAYTDDDCLPEKDWLANKLRNFSDPTIWACTGRVVQHSREGSQGRLFHGEFSTLHQEAVQHNSEDVSDFFEEVAGQDLGPERRVFSEKDIQFGMGFILSNVFKVFSKHMKSRAPVPYCIGCGASMAFRREIFKEAGNFDERFGSVAPLGACDDIEMLYRVLKFGHRIVYEPSAVIHHKQRFAVEEVFSTRYHYSFGNATFMREYRGDALMRVMFYGRLFQLMIKSAQYKLLGKKELAQSFSSDLRGFLDGCAAHKKFSKAAK